MAFTGPSYRTSRSGSRKRFGGVTAYGILRNLLTVAVDDGRTVVVPITRPGPRTAVGACLPVAAAAFNKDKRQQCPYISCVLAKHGDVGLQTRY